MAYRRDSRAGSPNLFGGRLIDRDSSRMDLVFDECNVRKQQRRTVFQLREEAVADAREFNFGPGAQLVQLRHVVERQTAPHSVLRPFPTRLEQYSSAGC